MRIVKRSTFVWNIAIFTLSGFLAIYISDCNVHNLTALSKENFRNFALNSQVFISLALISCFLIFSLSKLSKYFYLGVICLVCYHLLDDMSNSFSKIILLLFFAYISIGYYFFLLLKVELKLACYNPIFNVKDLFEPESKLVNCTVRANKINAGSFNKLG